MAERGHEERFLPSRLSAGFLLRKETIAGRRRNERDAPLPAVRETLIKPRESTQSGHAPVARHRPPVTPPDLELTTLEQ
jgi:hypothetical protein